MSAVFEWLALLLLLLLGAGLVRVWRGPGVFDRMLAAQLFGTGGVATLVLLSIAMQSAVLLDVALVMALLAALAGLALVRLWGRGEDV